MNSSGHKIAQQSSNGLEESLKLFEKNYISNFLKPMLKTRVGGMRIGMALRQIQHQLGIKPIPRNHNRIGIPCREDANILKFQQVYLKLHSKH